jgi:hypothetical protein
MKSFANILAFATAATLATSGFARASAPDAALASAFIGSGGGAGSFSMVRAFDRMLGPSPMLTAERQMRTRYGQTQADRFVRMFNFAIADAWTVASKRNVRFPNAPSTTASSALARHLLEAGTRNGTFRTLSLFDALFTPPVASQVMTDLDARYGPGSFLSFLRMGNRFFYDVGRDVDVNVTLAPNA